MSDDNCQIFICHLPKDISKNELEEEFQEFGTIRKIEIKNKFAFIEYKSAQSAKDAILKMDGNKVFGNKIVVQNAFKGEKKKDKSNNSENSSYSEKLHKEKIIMMMNVLIVVKLVIGQKIVLKNIIKNILIKDVIIVIKKDI